MMDLLVHVQWEILESVEVLHVAIPLDIKRFATLFQCLLMTDL